MKFLTTLASLMNRFFDGIGEGTSLDVKHSWGQSAEMKYIQLDVAAFTLSSTEAFHVPDGYEHFPGAGYYKLYTSPLKPWAEAQKTCQADGANLIVINSDAEVDAVKKIYSRGIPLLTSRGVWAGFHDQFKPGYYVTVFGDTLEKTGYVKWGSNQPVPSKHCGYTFKLGMLHTWQCEEPSPFLCELKL
ncbi:hemolymph lipopolysaccharide-binding protein [Anabrus simplex]|uniref:hemolymph lipopolysaccharide-binding protein n=1 Tax=Anabrus simplex TaxID=316456 RepID=UPI0035A3CCC1